MGKPRCNHTSAFKAKVVPEAVKGGQTLAELAQKFDVHATQVAAWKAELLKEAVNVFDDGKPTAEEKVDINRLHAKIGQLTLENDFLESALTKAGLLGVRK